jgi:hypothetical protein
VSNRVEDQVARNYIPSVTVRPLRRCDGLDSYWDHQRSLVQIVTPSGLKLHTRLRGQVSCWRGQDQLYFTRGLLIRKERF